MGKVTLLCVEDDVEALEDTVYLLKRYFDKVYSAVDGNEALNCFYDYNPDVVLLDINIPKIDGLKVASKIREKNKKIPIIFLTAHSEKEKLLKAIDLHVESYIIKPFKFDDLKKKINQAIEKVQIDKEHKNDSNTLLLDKNFIWNKETYELFYKDIQIALTKNEILLIKTFILNRSRFLTANELSLEICSNDNDISGNNVVQLISRFKKKILKQTTSADFFIENIYGSGYRIK